MALQALDKAILASPNSAILLKAKADLLLEWGHPSMAALTYELALSQLDGYGVDFRQETLHHLAASYQMDGNIAAAISTWERALKSSLSDLKALYQLTLLHYQERSWREAILCGQRYLLKQGPRYDEVKRLVFRAYQAQAQASSSPFPSRR